MDRNTGDVGRHRRPGGMAMAARLAVGRYWSRFRGWLDYLWSSGHYGSGTYGDKKD